MERILLEEQSIFGYPSAQSVPDNACYLSFSNNLAVFAFSRPILEVPSGNDDPSRVF
jgi:hypothetical protein